MLFHNYTDTELVTIATGPDVTNHLDDGDRVNLIKELAVRLEKANEDYETDCA